MSAAGAKSAVEVQNTQKAQDYTTVAVVVGATALALAVPQSRAFLSVLHSSSLVGALSVYGAVLALIVLCYKSLMNTAEWRGGGVTGILRSAEGGDFHANKVNNDVTGYFSNFGDESRKEGGDHDSLLAKRKENYMSMVNSFYTLVTDFYEYGWGACHTQRTRATRGDRQMAHSRMTSALFDHAMNHLLIFFLVSCVFSLLSSGDSFHFANRFIGESHKESLRRAEYFLASKLQLNESSRVLDIGCGIGGPMRAIARFSGAEVTGINNCDYQIKVGNRYNEKWSLQKKCIYYQADFMNLPVADNSFDAAYEIEATCHAPDKAACFKRIFNALKPGGLYAGYEWVVSLHTTTHTHKAASDAQ